MDETTCYELEEAAEELMGALEDDGTMELLPDDWELCLNGGGSQHSFVSHARQIRFSCPEGVSGIEMDLNARHYWIRMTTYPMHLEKIPPLAVSSFWSAMAFGMNEHALNHKDTSFPYTEEQISRLVDVFHELGGSRKGGVPPEQVSALIWHIAGAMCDVEEVRYKYQHGTAKARNRRDVVPNLTWTLQAANAGLSILLFGAYKIYRSRLQRINADGNIYLPDFHKLVKSLLVEWADSNLLATVFVLVNVGFLTLPSVRGLQQTSSLASTLLAVGSIAGGLHHISQHRPLVDADIVVVVKYFDNARSNSEELANTWLGCFLSLPVALLLWSAIAFGVALSVRCITIYSSGVKRAAFGTAVGFLAVLLVITFAFFSRMRFTVQKDVEEVEESAVGGNEDDFAGHIL